VVRELARLREAPEATPDSSTPEHH